MNLIVTDTWIFFIIFTIINGIIFRNKSKKYISKDPELKEGYDKYFWGILFYGNIPWIIMAIGNLSGMTYTTFEYFFPRLMNPIVLTFHASIIVMWLLSFKWIYFNNGAEFIEKHPGLFQKFSFTGQRNITAKDVKFYFPIMILGGIIAMIMMWVMDIPQFK